MSSRSISASYSIRYSLLSCVTTRKFSLVPAISLFYELYSTVCWKSKRKGQACWSLMRVYFSKKRVFSGGARKSSFRDANWYVAKAHSRSKVGRKTRKSTRCSFILSFKYDTKQQQNIKHQRDGRVEILCWSLGNAILLKLPGSILIKLIEFLPALGDFGLKGQSSLLKHVVFLI